MINLENLPPRLKRSEASKYLLQCHGLSRTVGTLSKLACIGGGPKFRKAGARRTLYDVAELDRWANAMLSAPMSSTSAGAVQAARKNDALATSSQMVTSEQGMPTTDFGHPSELKETAK